MRIMSWTRTMAGGRVIATRMQHRRSSSRPSSHHRSWPPRRPSADPLSPFQPPPACLPACLPPPPAPRPDATRIAPSLFHLPPSCFFPPHSESVDTWSEQETLWESEQSVFRGCVAHTASRDATAEGTRARERAITRRPRRSIVERAITRRASDLPARASPSGSMCVRVQIPSSAFSRGPRENPRAPSRRRTPFPALIIARERGGCRLGSYCSADCAEKFY